MMSLLPKRTNLLRSLPLLLAAALLTGCHGGDTNQGGGTDTGHATRPTPPPQTNQPVPTPPTADQVDPSSPRAVLGGTSTTQPANGTTQQPSRQPLPR